MSIPNLLSDFTHASARIVDHITMSVSPLADLIREARKRRGFSQTDLAREMSLRGYPITREAIGAIEAGNVEFPERDTAIGISHVLEIPMVRLLEAARWIDPAEADRRAAAAELQQVARAIAEVLPRLDRVLARLAAPDGD